MNEPLTQKQKLIKKINDLDYEIIFINDCSTDKSLSKLINHHEINNKIIKISVSIYNKSLFDYDK